MTFVDKMLRCRDCGAQFLFSSGEQEFYVMKGLQHEPQRCAECRAARRQARLGTSQRTMFAITCSVCGVAAQVPFNPRSDKPVYCSNCYDRVRDGTLSRSSIA